MEKGLVRKNNNKVSIAMGDLIEELMYLVTSSHKLHLKIHGPSSYAIHKALNKLYDGLPDHIDTVAEGWQGYAEELLTCRNNKPVTIYTKTEMIVYLRSLHSKITDVQKMMPLNASEIVSDLDLIKTLINSTKYKLLFLE
jgi:DNA-binding ferritin-like protein